MAARIFSIFSTSRSINENMSKQSLRVTLSVWLVLFLTAWNALRLFTAIAWRNVLIEYAATPPPWVTGLVGAVWLIVGCLVLWSIWWRKDWAGNLLLAAAIGYSVWYWVERLVWQTPRPNWLFAIALNLLLILFILFVRRALTRETYERKNKNPALE